MNSGRNNEFPRVQRDLSLSLFACLVRINAYEENRRVVMRRWKSQQKKKNRKRRVRTREKEYSSVISIENSPLKSTRLTTCRVKHTNVLLLTLIESSRGKDVNFRGKFLVIVRWNLLCSAENYAAICVINTCECNCCNFVKRNRTTWIRLAVWSLLISSNATFVSARDDFALFNRWEGRDFFLLFSKIFQTVL